MNGFQRLAAPAPINTDTQQGFDIDADPGVWPGKTLGFAGRQICFDKNMIGKEGEGGLGFAATNLPGTSSPAIPLPTFPYTQKR